MDRRNPPRRRERLHRRRNTQPFRATPFPLVAASEAQRDKVAGQPCLICGKTPADPAHIVPQRLGGCAHPDCVVPLCRAHHRAYDRGGLALGPLLGRRWRTERKHALEHTTRTKLRQALAGNGWQA